MAFFTRVGRGWWSDLGTEVTIWGRWAEKRGRVWCWGICGKECWECQSWGRPGKGGVAAGLEVSWWLTHQIWSEVLKALKGQHWRDHPPLLITPICLTRNIPNFLWLIDHKSDIRSHLANWSHFQIFPPCASWSTTTFESAGQHIPGKWLPVFLIFSFSLYSTSCLEKVQTLQAVCTLSMKRFLILLGSLERRSTWSKCVLREANCWVFLQKENLIFGGSKKWMTTLV